MARAPAPRELAGALLLSLAFGSIHAFGVLMAPLEQALQASRGEASLVYALAIASLTLGVFTAPRLVKFGASAVAALCGLGGALGIAATALLASKIAAWLGFGVLFGFCNGVAYSLFLARATAALPAAPGLAAGMVTAAYGLGAAGFAQLLGLGLAQSGWAEVLYGLAAAILLAGLAAAALFGNDAAVSGAAAASRPPAVFTAWLWLVYFLGASGGLMVIAHAAGIAAAATSATAIVAVGNVAGSLIGGLAGERLGARAALALPLGLTAVALGLLLAVPAAGLALIGLCGLAYGWLIAAIPVVIRQSLGPAAFAAAFGRVFTAWGVAGLVAPSLAGLLYDWSGNYRAAIFMALGAALAGLMLASSGAAFQARLPPPRR
jgi:OFA family oxalate/formate antiporter-like MFS transporter